MAKKLCFTKGRLIGFLCCALFPIIAIFFGIILLIRGMIFNVGFAITFIIIPLIAAGLLAWCILSGCKIARKIALSGVILILCTLFFLLSFIFADLIRVKHYENAEAKLQYNTVKSKNMLIPDLSEIGQASEIECYTVLHKVFFFFSEADYLICRYSPDEYALQKAALETKYAFQTEAIITDYENCAPSAEVEGYQFRLLSIEEYKEDIWYPKNLILIGYSDNTKEIVYVVFYDSDLDYIPSLKDFIADDCGWKHIQ